jgi:hypothetical protein
MEETMEETTVTTAVDDELDELDVVEETSAYDVMLIQGRIY